jgi:hypothetical protein
MGKCKSGMLQNLSYEKDDIVISHFLDITERPPVKKHILSLHEKELFPLKNRPIFVYDKIHYLNHQQRLWHGVKAPFFICQNVVQEIDCLPSPEKGVAGIIGTINSNKQTHISIDRALADGMDNVLLFGNIGDKDYFEKEIIPRLCDKVKYAGFTTNKALLYSLISDVYLSSLSENASLVADECKMLDKKFHGNSNITVKADVMNNNQIFDCWFKELVK